MEVYRKATGEKYTPLNHYGMTTQVIFNPESGCKKANITLSVVPKGGGSHDEVHEHSDQIFCMLKGTALVYAHGRLLATVQEGDAVLILAGETHSVVNGGEVDCSYIAITVPPLEKTR
jgi:mannose-6-phosphate isomerase-like protein (cupin superfamily)